jgi:tRNA(fMet)-specific endonuclease VapC
VRVSLDTNRFSDLLRGDSDLEEALERCREIFVPLNVLAELKAGFLRGSRVAENERLLRQLLAKPGVQVLLPSRQTAEYYARLSVQLRSAGTPIPINDIWIAALTLEHDLLLVTRDKHFERLPQLLLAPF